MEAHKCHFLIGRHWDENMSNISFREATKNIGDYILNAAATHSINPYDSHDSIKQIHFKEITIPTFYGIYKCITLDMPKEF